MKTKDKVANAIKWIDGLLVTRYKQGQGKLGSKKEGFCCLGYGCHILDIYHSTLEEYSPDFSDKVGLKHHHSTFLPAVQVDGFGPCASLDELNDKAKWSFNQIAKFMIDREFSMFEDKVSAKLVEHYKKS